jgi:hypothetical protein
MRQQGVVGWQNTRNFVEISKASHNESFFVEPPPTPSSPSNPLNFLSIMPIYVNELRKPDTFGGKYMANQEKWIYGELLMKRWNINRAALAQCFKDGLLAYGDEGRVVYEGGPDDTTMDWVDQYRYKISDVEEYEAANPHLFGAPISDMKMEQASMDVKEKRELGQLKREKEKWDSSIQASLLIGMFVQKKNQVLKRKDIKDQLYRIDSSLPDTAFEKIWKAIPSQYRHKGGRTKKEK